MYAQQVPQQQYYAQAAHAPMQGNYQQYWHQGGDHQGCVHLLHVTSLRLAIRGCESNFGERCHAPPPFPVRVACLVSRWPLPGIVLPWQTGLLAVASPPGFVLQ